jgi:hypothetical protein
MVNHSSGGKSSLGSCRVHASVGGRRLKWRRGRHHPAPSPGSPGFIHPAADQFLGQLADPPFASHRLAAAMRRETSRRQDPVLPLVSQLGDVLDAQNKPAPQDQLSSAGGDSGANLVSDCNGCRRTGIAGGRSSKACYRRSSLTGPYLAAAGRLRFLERLELRVPEESARLRSKDS